MNSKILLIDLLNNCKVNFFFLCKLFYVFHRHVHQKLFLYFCMNFVLFPIILYEHHMKMILKYFQVKFQMNLFQIHVHFLFLFLNCKCLCCKCLCSCRMNLKLNDHLVILLMRLYNLNVHEFVLFRLFRRDLMIFYYYY